MSQRKIRKLKKQAEILQSGSNVIKNDYLNEGLRQAIKRIVFGNIKWLAGITLLILVVYVNSLWGDFVSDDYASITQYPLIGDFWFALKSLNTMTIQTSLVYVLFGMSPVAYHLINFFNFLLFCWLAYIFLEMVFDNKILTRVTMFLFAVLPIHNEAVSWISGRIYLILAIYILIGLLGFVLFVRNSNPKYLIITFIGFMLGFLTDKPRPFALVFLIIIYLMFYRFGKIKIKVGKILTVSLIMTVVAVFLAWPNIINRINIVNSGTNASGTIFYDPFFQYPTSMAKYLQLLWFPADLTLYHTMYVFPLWLNWTITLTYLLMLGYFYFKNKKYFFALAFIFAAAAPSMAPVKVSWLVAERYMFLGSLGFCLFLGLVIVDLSKYFKITPGVLLVVLLGIFGVRTIYRNVDWQTNHNLWVNTCQVSPNSHNAWNNIGDDYDKLKDYANAIKGFTQSTIVKPNYADAYHNRANIFYKVGRLDLARESYNIALTFNSGLYQTYMSLIQIDLAEKKFDLAVSHAQTAVQMQPNDPQPTYVLAVVYSQVGRTVEAEKILTNLLQQVPNYEPAKQALAQLKTINIGVSK